MMNYYVEKRLKQFTCLNLTSKCYLCNAITIYFVHMVSSSMLLVRIKQLRDELNVQQRQIADAIGVDAPMYSRIERGIRPFRDEYIAPIAGILHVEEEELRSLWTADKIINVTKDESLLVAQRALHLANSEIRTNLHK